MSSANEQSGFRGGYDEKQKPEQESWWVTDSSSADTGDVGIKAKILIFTSVVLSTA